jgi:Protein of unknown function (DUF2846)
VGHDQRDFMGQASTARLVVAALFIGGSGCASVPMAEKGEDSAAKIFRPGSKMANVYVYRTAKLPLAIKYPIALDGEVLGELPGSTFVVASVRPGPHTVSVSTETIKAQAFLAKAGRNYYVQVTPAIAWTAPAASLTLMADEDEAQRDINSCNLMRVALPADGGLSAENPSTRLAWKSFVSRSGRFTVSFPGEPREASVQMSLPTGDAHADMYLVETSQAEYSVAVASLTSPSPAVQAPGAYLERAVDAMGRACKLVAERTFAEALPTLQADLDCKRKGRIRVRLVVAGTRLYQLGILARGGELPADADEFLASFVPEM